MSIKWAGNIVCVWGGGGELRREKGVGGGWLIRGESVCVRDKSCEVACMSC